MITQIKGQVLLVTEKSVVVNIGAIGYEVFITRDLVSKLKPGQEITLFTYFNVREDAHELYGFATQADLAFFKLLLTVSGIGPKSALNIIDTAKPDDIRQAITHEDVTTLHRIHGLGKKTAERLVTELKDKLELAGTAAVTSSDEAALLEAIVGLGYSLAEARQAVKEIKGQGDSLSAKIKLALQYLGRK